MLNQSYAQHVAIVMAGGTGSRLWLLSSNGCPKQFIAVDGESMFQRTLRRCQEIGCYDAVVVVVSNHYRVLADQQLKAVDGLNIPVWIIHEPAARNTGTSLAYALQILSLGGRVSPQTVVTLFPCDHDYQITDAVQQQFKTALQLAANYKIVCFGTSPRYAETEYGYIEINASSISEKPVAVTCFSEKPSAELARFYLNSGQHYWNCGIYTFCVSQFWQDLIEFDAVFTGLHSTTQLEQLDVQLYELPSLSFDVAIMEQTSHGVMLLLATPWMDLGSWSNLWQYAPRNQDDNAILSHQDNLTLTDCTGCLIYTDDTIKPVHLTGLNHMTVIMTKNGCLVAPLKRQASPEIPEGGAMELLPVKQAAKRHDR